MSEDDPYLEGFLLRYLRTRKGWSQADLGKAVGLSEAAVCLLERDRRGLKPKRMAAFTAALGYSDWEVQLYRMVVEGAPLREDRADTAVLAVQAEAAHLSGRAAAESGVLIAREFDVAFQKLLAENVVQALRRQAGRDFADLARRPTTEQRFLVEHHPDYQTPSMVEQLCLASVRFAAKDIRQTLRYAQLALRAAEEASGPASLRAGLLGFAWAFVANARRVGASLREAETAFVQADRFWETGGRAVGPLLEAWRIPDLKASLRRDQRRWSESLALSDRALALAPPASHGRILLTRAAALEPLGAPKEALKSLQEAAPLIECGGDPALLLILRFNLAVNLTHLGRLDEARRFLESARRLSISTKNELHLLHCLWLSGRIAGESGQENQALQALQQARGNFTALQLPLQAASVALDEAVYLLRSGETSRVKTLAEEIVWVFSAEGVREEALKALKIFYDAAREMTVSIELAHQVRVQFAATA